MNEQVFLQGQEFTTQKLRRVMENNPLSKSSISFFLEVYHSSKNYLDISIFNQIRYRIEEIAEVKFNLRKRLDKAKMGRFIVWGELTHRKSLPHNLQPITILRLEEPFSQDVKEELNQQKEKTQSGNMKESLNTYWQKLREYENFCRFLLVGRILPKPVKTNGIECSPLFRIFKGAYTLDQLNSIYKQLLQKWHPDLSSHSPNESRERFDYIQKAYFLIINNWNTFNPQNLDIPLSRINRLQAQILKWSPSSFWE